MVSSYVRLGSEILVNTIAPNSLIQPDSTLLNNGNFIVTWVDAGLSPADGTIKAQIFQPDGTPVGIELTLETATAAGVSNPSIASLANGGFVATWDVLGGIKAQIFDANGVATAAPVSLLNLSGSSPSVAHVAGLATGGFAVTWSDTRTTGADVSGSGIHLSVYDQNGNALVSQALVNTATTLNQQNSSVAALAGGGFVVTWSDHGVGGGNWQTKAQIYDPSGAKVGSEFGIGLAGGGGIEPAVVTLSNGNFAVAWAEVGLDGHVTDRIQIYTAQ